MQQFPLGKTGSMVSALAFGPMYFGTRLAIETSYQLADHYFEAGGRFIDTSNNYPSWLDGASGDESEISVGRWMRDRKNRDQIFLATKVGARPAASGSDFEHMEGLSRQRILRAIDESLERLGTDHIDLYYAHVDDRKTPLEDTLAAFDKLIQTGKVRYIGCSNIATWRIEEARNISITHDWAKYCCVQQRYSYLRPNPGADFGVQVSANKELLDYCQSHDDITLLAYSPLLNGSYTRIDTPRPEQYAGPDTGARMLALTKIANEVGATLNQVVLAWLLQSTPRELPIIAVSTDEQLRENLGALHVRLNQEQIEFLTNAG